MKPIIGKPEGRPGIWLITGETAWELLNELFDASTEIHNFIDCGMALLGANWSRDQVCSHVMRPDVRNALIFPPNQTMKHQLVSISDTKKWMFDIGVIDESAMSESEVTP